MTGLDETQERRILIADNDRARELFGLNDSHLRFIEEGFDVTIVPRGNEVIIKGQEDEVGRVVRLFNRLTAIQERGGRVTERDVRYAVRLAREGDEKPLADALTDVIVTTYRGKQIRPKTIGQKEYVDAIRRSGVTFGIGPAGTGKTYLAMAVAVAAFKAKEVARIILTRPAVEAGEKLGFLPGDLTQKVDPYLRPLYDALNDMLPPEQVERRLASGEIEVAPLAFMRGRTLSDAFVILDEAQNTTPMQMKMFLTRFGTRCRMVICGDPTQVDLPPPQKSGLVDAVARLEGIEGIAMVRFDPKEVVRHPLVGRIVDAYDADRHVEN